MAMGVGPRRGVKSDINVTPLVDVCLVLLIIFMVVTPMLQRGKDVQLPKAHDIDKNARQNGPLILSITRDHRMWLDKTQVSDLELEAGLLAALEAQPTRPILLKGDVSLQYGDVRKVMKVAEKVKARGVQLAVEELKDQ